LTVNDGAITLCKFNVPAMSVQEGSWVLI
jgi:hypothetical protein